LIHQKETLAALPLQIILLLNQGGRDGADEQIVGADFNVKATSVVCVYYLK
jgi:hypothetical protein